MSHLCFCTIQIFITMMIRRSPVVDLYISNHSYFINSDTFFTERYLGSDSSSGNYRGYEAADVARRAGNFVGRSLMLVTATGDMTAPAQHSLAFARSLIHQGVIFRHQVLDSLII